jgi:hypothetical protein
MLQSWIQSSDGQECLIKNKIPVPMVSPKHGKRNSVNKLSPIEPENNDRLPLYKEDEEFGKYLQDLKTRATRN